MNVAHLSHQPEEPWRLWSPEHSAAAPERPVISIPSLRQLDQEFRQYPIRSPESAARDLETLCGSLSNGESLAKLSEIWEASTRIGTLANTVVKDAISIAGGTPATTYTCSFPKASFDSGDTTRQFGSWSDLLAWLCDNVSRIERCEYAARAAVTKAHRITDEAPRPTPLHPAQLLRNLLWCEYGTRTDDKGLLARTWAPGSNSTGMETCDYHLESLLGFSRDRLPGDGLRDMQHVLKEIVDRCLMGATELLTLKHLSSLLFSAPGETKTMRGGELLFEYVRFIRLEQGRPEPNRVHDATLEKAIRHFTIARRSMPFSRTEEMALFSAFDFDPVKIFEAFAVADDEFARTGTVSKFLATFPGLETPDAKAYYTRRYRQNPNVSPRRLLVASMSEQLGRAEQPRNPATSIIDHKSVILSLCRKEFEIAPEQVLHSLRTEVPSAGAGRNDPRHEMARAYLLEVQQQVAEQLELGRNFEPRNIRPAIYVYPYQKEAAALAACEPAFIIGDETGLGKTLEALMALEYRGSTNSLWVTVPSNVNHVQNEIVKFVELHETDVVVLRRDDIVKIPEEDLKTICRRVRYVVTSMDTIAYAMNNMPSVYESIFRTGFTGLALDEFHLMDNPRSLRSKALSQLEIPIRYLCSATPWQSHIDRLFLPLHFVDPARFRTRASFRQEFLSSEEGIRKLKEVFWKYSVRRCVEEVAEPFLPKEEVPYEVQLADRRPRIPRKVIIPPDIAGRYAISDEQAETYVRILTNFTRWATAFNQTEAAEKYLPVKLEHIRPYYKLLWLNRCLYEPHKLGLGENLALVNAFERDFGPSLAEGKRVLAFGENTSILDLVAKSKSALEYGCLVSDGRSTPTERDESRARFMTGSREQLLIAQYKAGGIGLSYKVASVVGHLQVPVSISIFNQAEGRARRLVAFDEPHFAHDAIEYRYLIPTFPDGFIEKLKDSSTRELLSRGTAAEITYERLMGSNLLYRFVTRGHGDPKLVLNAVKRQILKSIGLV